MADDDDIDDDIDFLDALDELDGPTSHSAAIFEQSATPDDEVDDVNDLAASYEQSYDDGQNVVGGVLVDAAFDEALDGDGIGVGPLSDFELPPEPDGDAAPIAEDNRATAATTASPVPSRDAVDEGDVVDQRAVGLYGKFSVIRHDGRDAAGGDRQRARYFVLDYIHDEHGAAALAAYADSCADAYPELAADLRAELDNPSAWQMRRYHPAGERCEELDCFDCRERYPA